MSGRVNLSKAAPALYQSMLHLNKLAADGAVASGIDAAFSHLLRLRASQINGCAHCACMHTRDALAGGESVDRVSVLAAWRETGYFDAKERGALDLVEAITSVNHGQVPDEVYDRARSVLSDEQICAVAWLAVVINSWNRIAITSQYAVNP